MPVARPEYRFPVLSKYRFCTFGSVTEPNVSEPLIKILTFTEVELALVRSSVTSRNCRRTSNFPNLLVRRTSGIFSAIDTYLFKFGGRRENVFMSDIWVRKIEVSTRRLVPALSFYALTIEQNFVVPV